MANEEVPYLINVLAQTFYRAREFIDELKTKQTTILDALWLHCILGFKLISHLANQFNARSMFVLLLVSTLFKNLGCIFKGQNLKTRVHKIPVVQIEGLTT